MCTSTVDVWVRVGLDTRRIDEPVPGPVPVDRCIAGDVEALNVLGVRTIGSCCGRGHAASRPEAWVAFLEADRHLIPANAQVKAAEFPNYAGRLEVDPRGLTTTGGA